MRSECELPRVAGSATALRVLLLHLLRWAADISPSDCRLVAAAARARGGIAISFRTSDETGTGLAFGQVLQAVPAEITALAGQTGAVLELDPQGPSVWLRLAAAAGAAAD